MEAAAVPRVTRHSLAEVISLDFLFGTGINPAIPGCGAPQSRAVRGV
jgi:hypothetical protein